VSNVMQQLQQLEQQQTAKAALRGRQGFSWEKRFSLRRPLVHIAEDQRILDDPQDTLSLVSELLDIRSSRLDPPCFTYKRLQDFLLRAELRQLKLQCPPALSRLALVDDRRDRHAIDELIRNWESEGYALRPSGGLDVFTEALDERELYRRLVMKV
jgi:hypothetical protein